MKTWNLLILRKGNFEKLLELDDKKSCDLTLFVVNACAPVLRFAQLHSLYSKGGLSRILSAQPGILS